MSSSSHTPPSFEHSSSYSNKNETNFSPHDEYEKHNQYSPVSIETKSSIKTHTITHDTSEQDISISTKIGSSSPQATTAEDKHVWTKQEVELLLDLYENYKDQLKDPRVRKTKIWEDIAQIIRDRLESDVNGSQCNQKFRNLKADFQKVVEHNGRPGNFKRVCKYYERLASILSYPHRQMNMSYRVPHISQQQQQQQQQQQPQQSIPQAPKIEHCDNMDLPSRSSQSHSDTYYMNGTASPHTPSYKITKKRKSQDSGTSHSSSHYDTPYQLSPDPYYSKKIRKPCDCDCSYEINNLRESLDRINSYIVSRVAHEEERIRRVEEQHREKMLAVGRFLDIFKDFIHKMT